MFDEALKSSLRFFLAAAVLAAILCLFPARVEEVEAMPPMAQQETDAPVQEQPVGADLSERTGADGYLHTTLYYAPCGHSVQRRDKMPAQLVGLSREALEAQIAGVIPGAAVTGFSASEVDIALSTEIPCPLHWVLRGGEDGMLVVMQNVSGEALEVVRKTEVFTRDAPEDDLAALLQGRMFDDVQALEGYLESLSS